MNSQSNIRILVVDDDAQLRRFVVHVLECNGFSVIDADDGATGLKLFAQSQVALVVTDVVMPTMTGPEMVQRIVAIHPRMCIVFMTGTAGERGLLQFGTKYVVLHKPFTPAQLIDTVNEILKTCEAAEEAGAAN